MLKFKLYRFLLITGLAVMLSLLLVMGTGCTSTGTYGAIGNTLSITMVPDINLDIYFYFDQGSSTLLPKNITGTMNDIPVDSLAIWGIASNNIYTLGGALNFNSVADASNVYTLLPKQADVWTKISDRTIYVVQGSGEAADRLKSAISDNHFKKYSDSHALTELSKLPLNETTKPVAIGIIKPNKTAVSLIKNLVQTDTAATIDSIFTWGKPQLIIAALYSSQPISIANISQRLRDDTIWDQDLGFVASINSSYPGFIIEPITGNLLSSTGYDKVNINGLTEYRASFDAGKDKNVPIFINVSGNHVFVTASGKEDYAQTLMTGIKR
jgi:hypothetical protein